MQATSASSAISLPRPITFRLCGQAYALANQKYQSQDHPWSMVGVRAARARHPSFMVALEQYTEKLHQASEHQRGRTMRSEATPFSHRVHPTEVNLAREAYKAADAYRDGGEMHPDTLKVYRWVYGAVAWMIGLHT